MGQETRRERDDARTGHDLPNADGQVADGDLDAITGEDREGKPTGQDHSTENYGETMPERGVGAIQDRSDTSSDIVRIREESE